MVLESVVVTLLVVGRGSGILLLQDVGVDGVEVGTQPAGGGARQRHHANLKRRLHTADTSGKRDWRPRAGGGGALTEWHLGQLALIKAVGFG